jgi:hypothetical protein
MARLFADFRPAVLLAAIPLAACAGAPPYAPTVLAWPHAGESVSQYQADDFACRDYIRTHTAQPGESQAMAGSGTGNTGAIAEGAQSPADVAYAQCMKRKDYVVETTNWLADVTAPPVYGSGSAYPDGAADDTDVHRGGAPYYVTYPYAVGTLPFFFFARHHHDGFHRED